MGQLRTLTEGRDLNMAGLEFSHPDVGKGYGKSQQLRMQASWGANFGLKGQFTRGPKSSLAAK